MTKKNDELLSPLEALRQRVIQRVEALEDAPFLRSIEALVEAYTTEPEEEQDKNDYSQYEKLEGPPYDQYDEDVDGIIDYHIDGTPYLLSEFRQEMREQEENEDGISSRPAKDVLEEKLAWLKSLR